MTTCNNPKYIKEVTAKINKVGLDLTEAQLNSAMYTLKEEIGDRAVEKLTESDVIDSLINIAINSARDESDQKWITPTKEMFADEQLWISLTAHLRENAKVGSTQLVRNTFNVGIPGLTLIPFTKEYSILPYMQEMPSEFIDKINDSESIQLFTEAQLVDKLSTAAQIEQQAKQELDNVTEQAFEEAGKKNTNTSQQLEINFEFEDEIIDTSTTSTETEAEEKTLTDEQIVEIEKKEAEQKEKQTEEEYKKNQKIIQQKQNILNNPNITLSEFDEMCKDLGVLFSLTINSLRSVGHKIPTLASYTRQQIASMSRIELINAIGVDNVFDTIKSMFLSSKDWHTAKDEAKLQVLEENWEYTLWNTCRYINQTESFNIEISKDLSTIILKGNIEIEEQEETDEEINEDLNNEDTTNIEANEIEGNTIEHWQQKILSIDTIQRMPHQLKSVLSLIPVLNKNSNPIISYWGVPKIYTLEGITNIINFVTQGRLTYSSMIKALQGAQDRYKGLKVVLEDVLGVNLTTEQLKANPQIEFMRNTFFNVFSSTFQLFSENTVDINNEEISRMLNQRSQYDSVMKQIRGMLTANTHLLLTSDNKIKTANKETYVQLYQAIQSLFKSDYANAKKSGKPIDKASYVRNLKNLSNSDTDYRGVDLYTIFKILGTRVTNLNLIDFNQDQFIRLALALDSLWENLAKAYNDTINGKETTFELLQNSHFIGTIVPIIASFYGLKQATSFRANESKYQFFILPSYLTKQINQLRLQGQALEEFLETEFATSGWFSTERDKNGKPVWRCPWLRDINKKDPKGDPIIATKQNLNHFGKRFMKEMTPQDYTISMLLHYFKNEYGKDGENIAWFRVPLQSDKPAESYIRFFKRSLNTQTEIDSFLNDMCLMVNQEISRIITVKRRNEAKVTPIKNWDKVGSTFVMFTFLNPFLNEKKNSELGQLLTLKLQSVLTKNKEPRLLELIQQEIVTYLNNATENFYAYLNNTFASETLSFISKGEEAINKKAIREFVWNDFFASLNIQELLITDPAFYKSSEDMSKRLSELHSKGMKMNAEATYKGERVSDGYVRNIVLTDLEQKISSEIDNITLYYDHLIETANDFDKARYQAFKEQELALINNLTASDGQAFISPTGLRKKIISLGNKIWTDKHEQAYQNYRKGIATSSDMKVIYNVLKPFVYSQIYRNVGISNSLIGNQIKTPVQYKNSEFMLTLTKSFDLEKKTGRANIVKALFEFMEESHYDKQGNYKVNGIDAIQFESGTKVGITGSIDIFNNTNIKNNIAIVENIKAQLKEACKTDQGDFTNNNVIDAIPFEDYSVIIDSEAHYSDFDQLVGSQKRMLLSSIYKETDAEGNPITYTVNGKEYTAKKLQDYHNKLIAQNIKKSINSIVREFHLNGTPKQKFKAISHILTNQIINNPQYNANLIQALTLNEQGQFTVHIADLSIAYQIESLLNSIIKNRVNKQHIKGGSIPQVSNAVTSKKLHIRFKDSKGKLLKTKDEYTLWANAQKEKGNTVPSYEEYIKQNQVAIDHFETFAPVYNSSFNMFASKDGIINLKAIELLDPELLEYIAYRIPTGQKHAIMPCKIVGFMPQESEGSMMLPDEAIAFTGGDFDNDKNNIETKEGVIIERVSKEGDKHSPTLNYQRALVNLKQWLTKKILDPDNEQKISVSEYEIDSKVDGLINKLNNTFTQDPFNPDILKEFKDDIYKVLKGNNSINPTILYNMLLKNYVKSFYKVQTPRKGTIGYNNNKIIQIEKALLTHPANAIDQLQADHFEPQKKLGYTIQILNKAIQDGNVSSNQLESFYNSLLSQSVDQLYEQFNPNEDLSLALTQIHFYENNWAGKQLLGIFAVNNISAVFNTGNGYKINFEKLGISEFSIGGHVINDGVELDSIDYTTSLEAISQLLAAAPDTAKFPVLGLMNINKATVNILVAGLRIGIPFETMGLLLSSEYTKMAVKQHNVEGISLTTILANSKKAIQKKLSLKRGQHALFEYEDLSTQELLLALNRKSTNDLTKINYKIIYILNHLNSIAKAVEIVNQASKFNSVNSAVGPEILDTLLVEDKIGELNKLECLYKEDRDIPITVQEIISSNPITSAFAESYDIARQLFSYSPLYKQDFTQINTILKLLGNQDFKFNTIFKKKKNLKLLQNHLYLYNAFKAGVITQEDMKLVQELPKKIQQIYDNYLHEEFFKQSEDTIDAGIEQENYVNPFIEALTLRRNQYGKVYLEIDHTKIQRGESDKITIGWEQLYNRKNAQGIDQNARQLALDLAKYCILRNGFVSTKGNFIKYLPTAIKLALNNYNGIFTQSFEDNYETSRFLDQFIGNNIDLFSPTTIREGQNNAYNIQPVLNSDIVEITPNNRKSTTVPAIVHYIDKEGNNHYYKKLVSTEKRYYREFTVLGNSIQLEYNPAQSITQSQFEVEHELTEQDLELMGLQDEIVEINDLFDENDLDLDMDDQSSPVEFNPYGDNYIALREAVNQINEDVYDVIINKVNELTEEGESQQDKQTRFKNMIQMLSDYTEKVGDENFNMEEFKKELNKYC